MLDDASGTIYLARNGRLKDYFNLNLSLKINLPLQSATSWKVFNCAEPAAFNYALSSGAKWSNLNQFFTIGFNKTEQFFTSRQMCTNCQFTFRSKPQPLSQNGYKAF